MSLIKLMLYKTKEKRLLRLNNIKQHPFFANYNFDSINDLSQEPAYKVKIKQINSKDTIPLYQFFQSSPFEPKLTKSKYDKEDYRKYIYDEWLPNFTLIDKKN